MKTSIYAFDSYKEVMAHLLMEAGSRGQLSRASEALNCQPSFLSRAIKGHVHITPDQAFMLTQFWKLEPDERDYFQCLVDCERSSQPVYREYLLKRISEFKKNHESLSKRIPKKNFSATEQEAIYFSAWQWSALHFLVSIPEFQTAKALSSRLGIAEPQVTEYLKRLEGFGLVKQLKGRWQYAGGQFHLPKQSPFVSLYHQNWRARAVLDSQIQETDSVHYTTVLTLSKKDLKLLKELVLEFISKSDQLAQPSDPQEAVALTCDLFKI